MPTETTDIAIIGAGPIGLELAAALKLAGVDYVHVEAGPLGATMDWWAPGTHYFSSPERLEIAGVPLVTPRQEKATREEYLAYLRAVARQFGLDVRTWTRVTAIDRDDAGFILTTRPSAHGVGGPVESGERSAPETSTTERRLRAQRVVLAIGNMHTARRLGIPGEDRPHVSHYLDDPHRYFGGRVLIVGGKNSAVEAALRLYRCGSDVTISYRGDAFDPKRVKYWLRPEIEWLIDKGRIGWHPRTVPVEIGEGSVRLTSAVGDGKGEAREIRTDHVLLMTGYEQDATLFEQLGVELTGGAMRAPRVDKETMESSVPGVYVAGTAVGGTQERARIFIENSHVHVARIARALTDRELPWSTSRDYGALEE